MSEPLALPEPDITASETTAARIVRLRGLKGWSQASMADYLGVAQSTVAGYERGLPPLGPVMRLLDILETTMVSADGASSPCSNPADPAAGAVPPAPAALSGEAA